MFITSSYGVDDVNHAAMLSNFGVCCVSGNLSLGPAAGYGGLNHNYGGPDIGTYS